METSHEDPTEIIGKSVEPEDRGFDLWLNKERQQAVELSKSPDYDKRKTANFRVDLLDAASKIWTEYSALPG